MGIIGKRKRDFALCLLIDLLISFNYSRLCCVFSLNKYTRMVWGIYQSLRNNLISLFAVMVTVATMAIALDVFLFSVMNNRLNFIKVKSYIKKMNVGIIPNLTGMIIQIPVLYILSACNFLLSTVLLSTSYLKVVFDDFFVVYRFITAKDNVLKAKEIELIIEDFNFKEREYTLLREAIKNDTHNHDKEEYLLDLYELIIKVYKFENVENKYTAINQLLNLFKDECSSNVFMRKLFMTSIKKYSGEKKEELLFLSIANFIELQEPKLFVDNLARYDFQSSNLKEKVIKQVGVITLFRKYLINSSIAYMALENDDWNYDIKGDESSTYHGYLEKIASDYIEKKLASEEEKKVALVKLEYFYGQNKGKKATDALKYLIRSVA